MKVGELFIKLGFKSDGAQVRDFVEDILKMDFAVVKSVAGLYAFYVALRRIMSQAVETALAVNNFTLQTGLSAKALQQWGNLAEQVGSNREDIVSSVKALQTASAQIKLGQGNIAPFQMLGINPNQDPFKILDQLRERVKTLDPAMSRLILSQMGVSEGMLNVLKSSDELYASVKNQFYLNEQQTDGLIRLRMEWIRLSQNIKAVSNTIGAALAPAFRHALDFLKDLVGVLGNVLNALAPFKVVLIPLGALLFATFFPVVGLITGILLLIDDFYSYLEGGDSIFKGFYEGLTDFILSAEDFFKGLWDWIQKIIDGVGEIFSSISKIPFLGEKLGIAASPIMGAASSAVSHNKQDNHFSFIIEGAKGPAAVADEIRKKIQEVFSDTAYQSPLENK